MSENYAAMSLQVVEQEFVAPLHTPFVLSARHILVLKSRHADASAILLPGSAD